jgi:plastocyanin
MVSHRDMKTNRNSSRWLRRASWAMLCLLLLTAAACGGGSNSNSSSRGSVPASESTSTTQSASAPAQASALKITIDGYKYASPATVPPGAQITVINNDSAEHTVTSDTAGAFDTEVGGKSQATFAAPSQPGSYPFHCTYHPNMHGVLVVQ